MICNILNHYPIIIYIYTFFFISFINNSESESPSIFFCQFQSHVVQDWSVALGIYFKFLKLFLTSELVQRLGSLAFIKAPRWPGFDSPIRSLSFLFYFWCLRRLFDCRILLDIVVWVRFERKRAALERWGSNAKDFKFYPDLEKTSDERSRRQKIRTGNR